MHTRRATRIIAYLSFDGNCREAMQFYQRCLGGALRLQTVEESPVVKDFPPRMRRCILHAELRAGDFALMGTDMVGEEGLQFGNAVSVLLDCTSERQLRQCYEALSDGGRKTHAVGETFWGALFGSLTDKYGIQWLLNFDHK